MAGDLEPVSAALRDELGAGAGYADPGVGAFGLRNAVHALGDTFLEVVSPVRTGTTAGRYLESRGDGGYMAMFQLDELDAARAEVATAGVRVVWQLELPDISAMHLHPADMRGAIVSLDCPRPSDSWRWAGPEWTGRAGTGPPGRLCGVTIGVNDPAGVARLWGRLLGVEPSGESLALERSFVRFERADEERLAEIVVEVPEAVRRGRDSIRIGGANFLLKEESNDRR